MDCFLHEGIKVLYRVAMAILLLFYKHSSPANSIWMSEILKTGAGGALNKFCKEMPVSSKLKISWKNKKCYRLLIHCFVRWI